MQVLRRQNANMDGLYLSIPAARDAGLWSARYQEVSFDVLTTRLVPD